MTALLFIKGRSDMQMKLGTLFACRSFCFATSWRQSDLQCTMFYCMRREIFSDQFFGWIMVKGPDIKCIKNLGSCLKSNGGPRLCLHHLSWEMRTASTTSYNILQQQQRVTNLHIAPFFLRLLRQFLEINLSVSFLYILVDKSLDPGDHGFKILMHDVRLTKSADFQGSLSWHQLKSIR